MASARSARSLKILALALQKDNGSWHLKKGNDDLGYSELETTSTSVSLPVRNGPDEEVHEEKKNNDELGDSELETASTSASLPVRNGQDEEVDEDKDNVDYGENGKSETESTSESSSSSSSSSEDNDDLLYDSTYVPSKKDEGNSSDSDDDAANTNRKELSTANCSISSGSVPDKSALTSPIKKGRKRKKNPSLWKRNINKKLRNSGKQYVLNNSEKSVRAERKMRPPCSEKCKLRCHQVINEENRLLIFNSYWELGDLAKQWQFLDSSMEPIKPRYQYVRIGGTRKKRESNNAFYFRINGEKVRVCKLFFKNTLDIGDRSIRTVQQKRNMVASTLLDDDKRGKHGKQVKVDDTLKEGVKNFIEKIPKIESHYTRANTSKQIIEGGKSIADIHRDYLEECKGQNLPFVNYVMFYRIFTEEFNISFFKPKKDLCEFCCAFNNAEGEEKDKMRDKYDKHLEEKELARAEKLKDKEAGNSVVAVFDLQAVMQIPKGDVSVFYYKSKLNVLNFTIYDLKTNECECFVWDESNGKRGVDELGSCIFRYLKNRANNNEKDIVFYSDNCPGQNKNKFIMALYLYAVTNLDLKSITHKYLIKGHTQNEGDSAHSLIERQVKKQLQRGPMYTPESFFTAIRAAKKSGPAFKVNELTYEDFYDIKGLYTQMGPLNLSQLKISDTKVLRVDRGQPTSIFFKTSYEETDFREIVAVKKSKTKQNIVLTRAYSSKLKIPENKKKDLMELLEKNHIPKFYKSFFEKL